MCPDDGGRDSGGGGGSGFVSRQAPPPPMITEAQLRWAQFHRAQKAAQTQRNVLRLYATPEYPSDIPDCTSEISSVASSECISKGRKALLKISQRKYEQRRQAAAANHSLERDDDGGDDALEAIFAEGRFRRRRRPGYRHHNHAVTDASRRFEEAFCAFLELQQKTTTSGTAFQTPTATKIWTRPQEEDSYHPLNVQRTPAEEYKAQVKARLFSDSMRYQLAHVARHYLQQQPTNPNILNDDDEGEEEKAAEFETFIAQFEQHVLFHDDHYVANLVSQLECQQQQQTEELEKDNVKNAGQREAQPHGGVMVSSRIAELIDLLFQKEGNRSGTGTTTNIASAAQNHLQTESLVKTFVREFEALASRETLIAADGKLHKPTFARLLQQYLGQTKKHRKASPKMKNLPGGSFSKYWMSNRETATFNTRHSQDEEDAVLDHFIELFQQDDEISEIVDASTGRLNTEQFEVLLRRYLQESASTTKKLSIPTGTMMAQTKGLWGQFRKNVVGTKNSLFQGWEKNRCLPPNSLGVMGDRDENGVPYSNGSSMEGEDIDYDNRHDEIENGCAIHAPKLNESVYLKVGELFQILHEDDSLQAYSAFRQRHRMDDTSSLSSFRALPSGLRKALVANRRKNGLSSTDDDYNNEDDDSEHKDDLENSGIYDNDDDHMTESASEFMSSQGSNSRRSSALLHPDTIKNLQAAALMADGKTMNQAFIDTDESDVDTLGDGDGVAAPNVRSLLLSPTIITKRHQQAIRAVENRKWDQVAYLLSANPWLAEMTDVNTNQYILHKLAFYGAGQVELDPKTGEVISINYLAAPEQTNIDLVRLYANAVHKYDSDGNLPLHMAAASANLPMIKLLGDRFPGGASVRNEDGMLPLHLAIISCLSPVSAAFCNDAYPRDVVKTVTGYFPRALAVADNEGNLPIHIAAKLLTGTIGVEIICFLLDETDVQVHGPTTLRFRTQSNFQKLEGNDSMTTETTASHEDSSIDLDDKTNCLMVRNEAGETPLLAAIHAHAGWEAVEALANLSSIQALDSRKNNALHLLVSKEFMDPSAALCVLKVAPEASTLRNEDGMFPIEIACMQMVPREVILAMVLVDLPIDLDEKSTVRTRDGFGESWWYITCDCDDYFVDVVEEVVSMCTFAQTQALCALKNGSTDSLLARATPKCKTCLSKALRLAGRYEIVDLTPIHHDTSTGVKVYDAIDFGSAFQSSEEGRRVTLICFSKEITFLNETALLREYKIDTSLCEEVLTFSLSTSNMGFLQHDEKKRFFISVEQPVLTLSSVVRGMLGNQECHSETNVRRRYTAKVFTVLRSIAKALRYFHLIGLVHGNVSLENCAKYDDGNWKVANIMKAQKIGAVLDSSLFSYSSPPESVETVSGRGLCFRTDLVGSPSLDAWAFGKVAYEVIVCDSLLQSVGGTSHDGGQAWLSEILNWNEKCLQRVRQELTNVGVPESGILLITACLSSDPKMRPSMDDNLMHEFWSDLLHFTSDQ